MCFPNMTQAPITLFWLDFSRHKMTTAANKLTPVSGIFQFLQLPLQRLRADVRLLLQQLQLCGVDLGQADVLGLHLQPALILENPQVGDT